MATTDEISTPEVRRVTRASLSTPGAGVRPGCGFAAEPYEVAPASNLWDKVVEGVAIAS